MLMLLGVTGRSGSTKDTAGDDFEIDDGIGALLLDVDMFADERAFD